MSLSFAATTDSLQINDIINALRKVIKVNKPFFILKLKRTADKWESRHTKTDTEKEKCHRKALHHQQEISQLKNMSNSDLAYLVVSHSNTSLEALAKHGSVMQSSSRLAVRLANFQKIAEQVKRFQSKYPHWERLVALAKKTTEENQLRACEKELRKRKQAIVSQSDTAAVTDEQKKERPKKAKENQHKKTKEAKSNKVESLEKSTSKETADYLVPEDNIVINSENIFQSEAPVNIEEDEDIIDLTQMKNSKLKYVQVESQSSEGSEVNDSDIDISDTLETEDEPIANTTTFERSMGNQKQRKKTKMEAKNKRSKFHEDNDYPLKKRFRKSRDKTE